MERLYLWNWRKVSINFREQLECNIWDTYDIDVKIYERLLTLNIASSLSTQLINDVYAYEKPE